MEEIGRDDSGQRFPIRFGRAMAVLMRLLGMGPRSSYVTLDGEVVRARMGWAFQAAIPRSSVVEVRPERYVWWAYGVHYNGRRRWIVNGSGHGVVALRLEPATRARVLGLPIRLQELWVSVDDPGGLRDALQHR